MLFNAVSEDAGQPGFSHSNIKFKKKLALNLHKKTEF